MQEWRNRSRGARPLVSGWCGSARGAGGAGGAGGGVVRGASLGLGRVGRVERDGDSGSAAHFLQVADAIELQATLYTPITPLDFLFRLRCFLIYTFKYLSSPSRFLRRYYFLYLKRVNQFNFEKYCCINFLFIVPLDVT